MNIIIALLGTIGVLVATSLVSEKKSRGIKFHLIMFLIKLILFSLIIGIFLLNTEKNIWTPFILSGMVNIIIFHFLEALFTQNKLLYIREIND